MSGSEAAIGRNTGLGLAGVLAAVGVLGTAIGLLAMAAFSGSNLASLWVWCLGLLGCGVAAYFSMQTSHRLKAANAVPLWVLCALLGFVLAALLWSVTWMGDFGDWPFFGAPPMLFAMASAVLVFKAIVFDGRG